MHLCEKILIDIILSLSAKILAFLGPHCPGPYYFYVISLYLVWRASSSVFWKLKCLLIFILPQNEC